MVILTIEIIFTGIMKQKKKKKKNKNNIFLKN